MWNVSRQDVRLRSCCSDLGSRRRLTSLLRTCWNHFWIMTYSNYPYFTGKTSVTVMHVLLNWECVW